jgi:CMP/dCMP kinase
VIVAIDGPAASGKSTTARAVARETGFLYLDTGAMYRAVGVALKAAGFSDIFTEDQVREVLPGIGMDVRYVDGSMHLFLNGRDVTREIRTQEAGELASRVAAMPEVRGKLVAEQRRIAREQTGPDQGIVIDGRDIGTVVFPDADLKIFMNATVEERARRRQRELEKAGEEVSLEEIQREILMRDEQDESREHSPLKQAEDAILLDTSRLAFDEQVTFVLNLIRERQRKAHV